MVEEALPCLSSAAPSAPSPTLTTAGNADATVMKKIRSLFFVFLGVVFFHLSEMAFCISERWRFVFFRDGV